MSSGFNYESCDAFFSDRAHYCSNTSLPASIPSNADVAGKGIILSFVITVWTTFVLALLITIGDFFSESALGQHPLQPETTHFLRRVGEPMVAALSDTQILTGSSLLIAGFLTNSYCGLTVYHYQLISWMLILSILSHAFAFQVLAGHFFVSFTHGAGVLRVVIIGTILGAWIYWVQDAETMPMGLDPLVSLPAECYYNIPGKNLNSLHIFQYVAWTCSLLTLILSILPFLRSWVDEPEFGDIEAFYCLRSFLPLIQFAAAAVYTWALIRDWQAPGTNGVPPLNNEEQWVWTFGQIIPMVLLGFVALIGFDTLAGYFKDQKQEQWDVVHNGCQNGLARSPPFEFR